ncbi:phage head morphogenesis protein [Kitasatospora sp. RB6PN24]|uniref:phage head morphogenesis protein n=1 Tax=Kitasatospora humi TaxID=2893891 RepID=UPI001E5F6715|nr:phage head morphogenesis protein [Kitasatospora humi]MCC9309145.1 phage head morphogenesis protein [Kitasatospora humi]
MARLDLPDDLAARLVPLLARQVERLAEEVAVEARRRAPAGKTWRTVEDGKARPDHQELDGQTLPAPVLFQVGDATMTGPRDPNGPVEETANCRCSLIEDPEAVADAISSGKAATRGTRTSATVSCSFPHIAEAEYSHGEGGHFMSGAASQVAARQR